MPRITDGYTSRVGDLVHVRAAVEGTDAKELRRCWPNFNEIVFEVVSMNPLRLALGCEPPFTIDVQYVDPVPLPRYWHAKLAYGACVRMTSARQEYDGRVGWVGRPRGLMEPFSYEVWTEPNERGEYISFFRPENLVRIIPPALQEDVPHVKR